LTSQVGPLIAAPNVDLSKGACVSRYWSELARGLTPYVPGEQPQIPGLVKLNTNESPFGPSPKVIEAVRQAADDTLRLYPDPQSTRLRQALATYHGVALDEVFVGNGSDEVLAHTFAALLKQLEPVLFPDVTYSFYPVYCGLYGVAYQALPLDERFELRVDDYLRDNGGIVFPNPNAPTGIALPLSAIERLLEHNRDSVVVIDEAYVDFGAESAVQLTRRYPQLLVTQTLSKSRALAGLRVGLAVGDPQLLEALIRVKDSFNSYPLDRLAICAGAAAFHDVEHFERTRQLVIEAREALVRELGALGMQVLPSAANFVFARHPGWQGAQLAQALRERAVLVRHFRGPRTDPFLRITIGLPEENAALLTALREILR
jgi:histidinol-phosphate aminotransferase